MKGDKEVLLWVVGIAVLVGYIKWEESQEPAIYDAPSAPVAEPEMDPPSSDDPATEDVHVEKTEEELALDDLRRQQAAEYSKRSSEAAARQRAADSSQKTVDFLTGRRDALGRKTNFLGQKYRTR